MLLVSPRAGRFRVILERSEESRLRMRNPNMRRGQWVSRFLVWGKRSGCGAEPVLSKAEGRLLEDFERGKRGPASSSSLARCPNIAPAFFSNALASCPNSLARCWERVRVRDHCPAQLSDAPDICESS